MDPDLAHRHAQRLHRAHRAGEVLDAAAHDVAATMAEAYAVQDRLTDLRLADGRRLVGHKLGYTSAAMREQMGVAEPNHGPLFDDMLLPGVATGFVQPRVEPEIGVVLGRDLHGDDLDLDQVAAAVAEVRPSLEVVDSVWADYRFTVEQNTADGSSAAGVVLGPPLDVDPLGCHRTSVRLLHDGVEVATATGAAAGGHPLAGVAWLCARLAQAGRGLAAGQLVITGGLTAAVPLRVGGTVEAVFDGRTAVRVTRD
ncbi:fumarylacetoacetate hydrolase family protein [Pseudonocardia petroleophila]|uniref:Fumarylacetoacetate hydrolase family protein n=1 Tax=Pseudonocardia petroleophila TaxID=37331 RepID=A0A7G7MFR0_9PSEU|nr:fumarylacetoacetate hydrolase family protein [Pseudonocardia petroleophila]QNG51621.1 fumarylacetoacetate hydrolase family protein [Pseudonocardia petroleophila]